MIASNVVELVAVCPHCKTPGKAQQAQVRRNPDGFGWGIGEPDSRVNYEPKGILTCEACKRQFAYRLVAVPRLEVAAIEWQS